MDINEQSSSEKQRHGNLTFIRSWGLPLAEQVKPPLRDLERPLRPLPTSTT